MLGQDVTTGAIEGVIISAVSHEGLSVTVDGKPGRLAILAEDGRIVAHGEAVAQEVEAVAVNSFQRFLQGKGWMKVTSNPTRRFRRQLDN